MKYVVTGGAGFIGSHLVGSLASTGHDVVVIDDLSSGSEENIQPLLDAPGSRVTFVQDTVQDFESLVEYFQGADGIYHLAAMVSVPRSIAHPLASHEVTLTGTLNVLTAARDAAVPAVVYASSAAVYGDLPGLPKDEGMPTGPRSPYAVAKRAGEEYCGIFADLYGVRTVTLRYFNVYGPRQDPRSDYAAVIPLFIARLLRGELPLIHGDGSQTRDFVFVKDVVRASILAMEGRHRGIYNIASGKATSITSLALTLQAIAGVRGDPGFGPGRPGDILHSVADITRATRDLKYIPSYTLEEGLRETVAWFRAAGSGR